MCSQPTVAAWAPNQSGPAGMRLRAAAGGGKSHAAGHPTAAAQGYSGGGSSASSSSKSAVGSTASVPLSAQQTLQVLPASGAVIWAAAAAAKVTDEPFVRARVVDVSESSVVCTIEGAERVLTVPLSSCWELNPPGDCDDVASALPAVERRSSG